MHADAPNNPSRLSTNALSSSEFDDSPRGDAIPERRMIVLGSTGSIGRQTLDVVAHLNALHARGQWPTFTRIVGLAAGRNAALLAEQAERFDVPHVAISDGEPSRATRITVRGQGSALELVRTVPCEIVMAAMVGSAGLPATLAAVELGRDVALANKETLVAAGALVIPAARRSGSRLLPVDSEHSALWQCLQTLPTLNGAASHVPPMTTPMSVARAILTASGGPFRAWTKDQIRNATPEQALKHPTWSMGEKITIDSASLMNKGLEIIEAHWLFGLESGRIAALIHPQSIVHAILETADGSMIAQLGAPDMRAPIQYALSFPHRPPGCASRLDLAAMSKLEFHEPDLGRFPALGLAYDAINAGGTAGAILNAANEVAVQAFLSGRSGSSAEISPAITFGRIAELVAEAMAMVKPTPLNSLADCLAAELEAREWVRRKTS